MRKFVIGGLTAVAIATGPLAGAAALLGGVGAATAHAEPNVSVAPNGSRYYGDQGDGNGLAYLTELRDVGLTDGTPVGAAVLGGQICAQRAQGATELALLKAAEASGWTMAQAVAKVVHAEYHFCPDAMYSWPGHGES